MDLVSFLTAQPSSSGPLVWLFFGTQIVGLVAGFYLAFFRTDKRQVRKQALDRLGFALIGLAVFGLLIAGLRLTVVPPLNVRFLPLVVLVLWLALAIYAFYYARVIYPKQVADFAAGIRPAPRRSITQQQAARVAPTPRPTQQSRAKSAPSKSQAPIANSGVEPTVAAIDRDEPSRRDSRRERKRRKK